MLQDQLRNFVQTWITLERTAFLCANRVKVYQFKAKDSETKLYSLCLANISIYFEVHNMKKPD